MEAPPEGVVPAFDKPKRESARRAAYAQKKVMTWWQKNADIEYLKSIPKIHWIGWINEDAAIAGTEKPRGVEGLRKFNRLFKKGRTQRDVLSTVGYPGRIPPTINAVGIIIDEGWPTFASSDDLWTNELYMSTEADRKFYSASGLPKRPTSEVDPVSVIFDAQDVDGKNPIAEITVDNWSWSKIYLGGALGKKEVQKLKSFCKSAQIDIINNKFKGI